MKAGISIQPHLVINEQKLARSGEWTPHFKDWCFIQIKQGISYWQQPDGARELGAGSVLVLAGEARGDLRASQLSAVELAWFHVDLEKLAGVLSLREQRCLRKFALQAGLAMRTLPPTDAFSERFKGLWLSPCGFNPAIRLQLLQLFIEYFRPELDREPEEAAPGLDGRSRLRNYLRQMTVSEFLELSLTDLAPELGCSPRHLSRLFRDEAGVDFRQKKTELRLAKACELLAASDAKVSDVALTSGYTSNSLFSLLFKKRFGVSPGEWRERHRQRIPKRSRFDRVLAL